MLGPGVPLGCSGSALGCVGSAGIRLGRDRDLMACDAVTGPLVQSGWLSPFCALHQPWASTPWGGFQGRFIPAPFPWLMGRAASPHPLFLRARGTDIYMEQCGPWAPWPAWRLCLGVWGREGHRAQSRGSSKGLLSVGVSSSGCGCSS